MKHLLRLAIIIVFSLSPISNLYAISPNFYHRIDLTSGNLYSFAASNLLSAGLNKLSQDRLLDTSFGYTYNSVTTDWHTQHAGSYNIAGLLARDLFADTSLGIKLGYQSFNFSWFNWGVFASIGGKYNRFKWKYIDDIYSVKYQRLQPGTGLLLSLGSMESSSRIILECQIKYNIPFGNCGAWGDKASEVYKNNFSSHYSLRFAGASWLQGFGIFAEILHGNPVKSTRYSSTTISLKSFTFGITYTICPWDEKL